MQKLTLITFAVFFTAAVFGQGKTNTKTPNPQKSNTGLYCAELKQGKLIVTVDGRTMLAEDSLQNGWRINGDGTITKKDGTKTTLKDGQCIDKAGTISGKGRQEGWINNYGLQPLAGN